MLYFVTLWLVLGGSFALWDLWDCYTTYPNKIKFSDIIVAISLVFVGPILLGVWSGEWMKDKLNETFNRR